VESKRCYPESAIKGWRQQAKEKEQQAKIDEAYQATAVEVAYEVQRGKEVPPPTLPPPSLGPSIPLLMRDVKILKPKEGEVVETITTF